MIFPGIRSSCSAGVLFFVREDPPSCLDVFFSAVGRSGEVVITILFCCLAILLILTWWVKCSPFLNKSFLCFSQDLSHHSPHPFVLNLQLVYSISYMLVSFFPFFLLNSLPMILLQASQLHCSNIAIHSSMWSLPVHAWKSANICSHSAIVFTLICDKNVLMLTKPHKIFLLTVIFAFIRRTTINFPLVTLHLLLPVLHFKTAGQ